MEHMPVLFSETIEGLAVKPDGIYVDGTLGRGGHALEIAKRLKSGRLIAIDCDEDAIAKSSEVLAEFKDKTTFIHGNFRDLENILKSEGLAKVDGMLFDLGVSSPQLDENRRGFSYMHDAKLDMRMNKSERLTAYEIVNSYTEEELRKILFGYGEERYSKAIVGKIVKRRTESPIETTYELNDIILSAIPASARREKQHPSKRTFQALRIAVNDELNSLSKLLETAIKYLKHSGRLCIISFHSLEDRLVKKTFVSNAQGCVCPKNMPICGCNSVPTIKLITRKPITAGVDEIANNTRARSAKLRIAEKII